MRKLFFTGVAFLFCNFNFAQSPSLAEKEKGESRINFVATPQLYLNSSSVENDKNTPNTISTKNTLGYNLGLQFQRITRYGLILGGGLFYGHQNHDVKVDFSDLSYFDPAAQDQLKLVHDDTTFSGSIDYASLKLGVGYRFKLPGTSKQDGWNIEVMAALSTRFYTKRHYEGSVGWSLSYMRDGTLVYVPLASRANASYGFGGSISSTNTVDFYIGICKKIKSPFLRNIGAGIELSHSLGVAGSGEVESESWNYEGKKISTDKYLAKDFSLGLRIILGLWNW